VRIDSDPNQPMEAVLVAYQQVPRFSADHAEPWVVKQSLAEERLALVRIGLMTYEKEFDVLSAARDQLNALGFAAVADRIDQAPSVLDVNADRIDMREALVQGRVFALRRDQRMLSAADVVGADGRETVTYFQYAVPDDETFAAIQHASATTLQGLSFDGRWVLVDGLGRRDPGYGKQLATQVVGPRRGGATGSPGIALTTAEAQAIWTEVEQERDRALLRLAVPLVVQAEPVDTVREPDLEFAL